MVLSPKRRLFTVDEYYRMAEAGIFSPDDRLELLDGEIIEMTSMGPRHAATVSKLTRILIDLFGSVAEIRPQVPARLDDLSEPEPDICLARPRADSYAGAHPIPDDLLLVIEIADSTIEFDLGRKVPKYALTGIPEVWVVDLTEDRLEVFRRPSPDGYAEHRSFGRGEHVSPEAFPDVPIAVDDVIP